MSQVSAMSNVTLPVTTLAPLAPLYEQPQQPTPDAVLETSLKGALEHARRLIQMHGAQHPDVAIAWETVEELQTAQANRKASRRSGFERYCDEYPEALECRMYDV